MWAVEIPDDGREIRLRKFPRIKSKNKTKSGRWKIREK